MIMQEYQPKRIASVSSITIKSYEFDTQPIKQTKPLSNNISSADDQIATTIQKQGTKPFPYLKRKSIRVDLILKQEKLTQRKNNQNKLLETLRNDNIQLENENLTLKGRISQMEFILQQLKSVSSNKSQQISVSNQICQTINESTQLNKECNKKKHSIIQCSKCNKSISSKYFKYHERICGNTKIENLLSEKDLKSLQLIRKNQKLTNCKDCKPKNNWRLKRKELLTQLKLAQKKTNSKCLIFYRPNFRKSTLNQ